MLFRSICRDIYSAYKVHEGNKNIMTEITTVSKAHSKFHSLKTTIPNSLVKEWKLKPSERLEWNWIVVNNKMIMTIKKLGHSEK